MNRKLLRKFNFLAYEIGHISGSYKKYQIYLLLNPNEHVQNIVDYFNIGFELGYNEAFIFNFNKETAKNKNASEKEYTKTPIKNNRDNKDTHIGGGGSNGSKVRYPSKKRSVKTWKKFYNLFPNLAIRDNWDGKKSDRYDG